jgi:hypothetical protein
MLREMIRYGLVAAIGGSLLAASMPARADKGGHGKGSHGRGAQHRAINRDWRDEDGHGRGSAHRALNQSWNRQRDDRRFRRDDRDTRWNGRSGSRWDSQRDTRRGSWSGSGRDHGAGFNDRPNSTWHSQLHGSLEQQHRDWHNAFDRGRHDANWEAEHRRLHDLLDDQHSKAHGDRRR